MDSSIEATKQTQTKKFYRLDKLTRCFVQLCNEDCLQGNH